jgi:uncharacterized delta-60 repeat protein
VEPLENRTLLSAGALDTTFGVGGKVTTLGIGEILGMVQQADGRILAVGTGGASNVDGVGVRYLTDGSLDTTLDGDGKVLADFPGSNEATRGVAIQSDGKVVVAGFGLVNDIANFLVLRYNSNGSVDSSFGGNIGIPGLTATGFGASHARGVDVAVLPDGKILVLGGVITAPGFVDVALARYNTNGSLDTTFDGDGTIRHSFGLDGFSGDGQMVIQPDGKIVAAGFTNVATSDFVVARFNSSGTLDSSFDGDGHLTTDFGLGELARDVALQSDGKIVVVGLTGTGNIVQSYAAARYNTNGSLDTTFDGDGKVITDLASGNESAFGVAIQPDGKIVVVGNANNGAAFGMIRYNANGSPDTSFDTDGIVITSFSPVGGLASARTVLIQPDGKIAVGGKVFAGGEGFALARYDAGTTPGFTVTPTSGLFTTEAGDPAQFTVALDTAPTANVTITLSSSDTGEGTVSPTTLTFTPANFSTPQTVTITGVDDPIVDGDQLYTIVLASAVSTDPNYNGVNPVDVTVTNLDFDFPGVTVTPLSNPMQTTESLGGTAQFTVVLDTTPTGNVTIAVSSSNTAEGTVSTNLLTFTPANFGTPQTVTVTGVNDSLRDGDQSYSIDLAETVSSDPNYNGLFPDTVFLENVDNDIPGFTVLPVLGLLTTEAGGTTGQLTVVLTVAPTADVTIAVSSSNTAEGDVAPTTLTFTPANFSIPQTVNVTSVDDAVTDGDVQYAIVLDPAASSDAGYNGLDPTDVPVINLDDDIPGITVSPTFGLTTTEAGGTAQFTVVLDLAPTADVTIAVNSSNTAEGTVEPTTLTFTSANFATPQTVTVTGVDDSVSDGDREFTIILAAATSGDANYGGRNPQDVAVTNVNDDPNITAPVLDNSGSPYVIAPAGSRLSAEMSNGILITELLARGAGGDPISDPDPGAQSGIALTGISKIDGTFGKWQYSRDPNLQDPVWFDVEFGGAISDTSALLLPADADTRLRFVTTLMPRHNTTASDGSPRTPAQGFLPLETKLDAGLTFRAWDRTSGTAGGRADTTTNGGTTAFSIASETAGTYFETRLYRSFNAAAQLNTYTLEQEFNALVSVFGYQDRATADFSGFTILMSPIPGVATSALYRMYFGIAFDSPSPGIQTDMGYRYLTNNLTEVGILENIGPESHRAERDGFYYRELGVNGGTGITGYIYATQQPGTTSMVQIYRTDLFSKDTRTGPAGSPATGTVQQEQGDHAYTTKPTFEMTKTGTWRQESSRGFVRELSPNAGGQQQPARRAPVQAALFEVSSTTLPSLDGETGSSRPSIDAVSRSGLDRLLALETIGVRTRSTVTLNSKQTTVVESQPVRSAAQIANPVDTDSLWSEFGAMLSSGLGNPWDAE